MASATRLPLKSLGFTIILVAGAGASRANLRKVLIDTFTGPGSYSRIAVVIALLLNFKSLPFVWHFRVLGAIYKHCYLSLPNIPPASKPSSLFLPVITTSRPNIWECDYNVHKSNSTYFSDLDVTRAHLVCVLLQPGIDALNKNAQNRLVLDPATGKPVASPLTIALGAVSCSFKREIRPYEHYEMWTRLLCWDRKWIYTVTHFVKKGSVRPREYVLTDGSWFGGSGYKRVGGKGEVSVEIEEKNIFATSIAKYVCKKGRLTVHPEVILDASGLLPVKPTGWVRMDGSVSKVEEVHANGDAVTNGHAAQNGHAITNGNAVANGQANGSATKVVDWKRIETQNEQGLKFAEHFQALEGLHQEFTGSRQAALGKYRDLIT